MNDLTDLLERAAGPTAAPVDADADLTRGRVALSRTRRRRTAAGLVGVAAAAAVGVGTGRLLARDDEPQVAASDTPSAPPSSASPAASGPVTEVGAFSFDRVPAGWEPQAAPPDDPGVTAALGTNLVTFATADFPDKLPENFEGKLVVMFNGAGVFGERRQVDGRTVWVNTTGGGAYTQIYVRTRPGEPQGVLEVQYPDHTGWSEDDMIAFLDGIHLGPGASPNTTGG